MRKLSLFKALLVAVCLLGGSDFAWGESTTIYEKAVTDWTSSDVIKTGLTADKWYNIDGIASQNYYSGIYVTTTEGLRLISRNGGVKTAELELNRSENSIVTIDAVWNAGAASSDSNTPYNIFTYGDFSVKQTVRSTNYKTEFTINGVTTTIDSNSKVTYRSEGRAENGNELTIHLKVNSFNGNITEFYILAPDASELVSYSNLTSTTNHFASGANYNIIRTTTYMSGSSSYAWNAVKSITVKEETQTIYTYKINAVDPSNNLLETLYEYQSLTLSEEPITQYWKKGLNVGGVWYMADAQATAPHYGHTFTTEGTFNVIFRPTDVIYYAEAEDIASGLYDQVNCKDYTSNGNARFFQAKKSGKISTGMGLAEGLYDVFVAAIDRSGKSATLELYRKTTGGVETKIGDVKTSTNSYLYSNTFSNVSFEAGEELYSQPWTSEYNATFCLDYITVAKSKVAYKVKYMCGEAEIKTADDTRTATWGTKVELTAADRENIADADLGTYEYVSDDADEVTIAMDGTSVITVQFTAKSINYTVKAVDQSDNELTTLASGDATADGSTTVYWSKYIKVDDKWYETVEATYGKAIKVANNTVTYKSSKISYFNEGETMTGYNAAATQSGTDFSGGVSGRHKANTSWITTEGVAAGSYIISFPYKAHTSSSESIVSIYEVKTDESVTLIDELSMTVNGTYTKYDVELAEGSKLRITKGDGNSNWCIDYVTLSKLYEQTTVTGKEIWDWSKTELNIQLTTETTPKKADFAILKNYELYNDVTIPAAFGDAQKLKVKGEYPFRSSNHCFQGSDLKFSTTVPGIITVDFSCPGNDDAGRYLMLNGSNTEFMSKTTSIEYATNICVAAGEVTLSSSKNFLRFYKITFTPTLNTAGYSTFSSSENVQVSGANAYTAQLDLEKGTITCRHIAENKIPAGNGVLLFGDGTSPVTFTTIASAPALGNNDLKATTLSDGSLAAKGENTYYVLNGDTFKKYTGAAFSAGKAYFEVSGSTVLTRSFNMVFDEVTTIISEVGEDNSLSDNVVYNLSGQRVAQPTKGLYIVNGKKMVLK